MSVPVSGSLAEPETALTAADREFFAENGYVVIPDAVPAELLPAVIKVIWDFLDMDPERPQDWYRPPLTPGGMVELYQHQAMWDVRQHPRLHRIFTEILGTERLWVTNDRVSMRPPRHPAHPEFDHPGFIHWDWDTAVLPVPFGVQGVLALADTSEDQGGFCCVPGMHRTLEDWIRTQPPNRDTRRPDLTGLTVKNVATRAGDLIVWRRDLAHGNGRNLSDRPRLAQYVTMFEPPPEADAYERQRADRITAWKERRNPIATYFPGDPRRVEWERYETATLTDLGRRLLGLDPWPPSSR